MRPEVLAFAEALERRLPMNEEDSRLFVDLICVVDTLRDECYHAHDIYQSLASIRGNGDPLAEFDALREAGMNQSLRVLSAALDAAAHSIFLAKRCGSWSPSLSTAP